MSSNEVFSGGGELGALMRSVDWESTPLGPVRNWSQALRTAIRIMLTSRQPMFVWWGDQLINLYNDAYRSILGGKHPQALGQPAHIVWREIWDQVGPRAASALKGDSGTYDESLLLIMERNGYPEETYYTFSYSPVANDDGQIGGIFCANTDDTQRIIGERQIALLRILATQSADARTIDGSCEQSALSLATDSRDLPFALIYLFSEDHESLSLCGSTGIRKGTAAAPRHSPADENAVWPFAEVVRTNGIVFIHQIPIPPVELPTGPWPVPPSQAVAVPLAPTGQSGRSGVLIAGLNPYRRFDDSYAGFLKLVAGQIAAAIANAQAYEDERKRAEALAEIDRAKTTFFSNVSHEFRTPLTLMLGTLEEMLAPSQSGTEQPGSEEQRNLAAIAHRNAMRLLKLVNTLLDFSRIEAGRMVASYSPTDISEYTRDLAASFRSAAEKVGLAFNVRCQPISKAALVDRDMWEKIVLNLLSNALKYTFEGSISVDLYQDEAAAVLEVRDTGIGIPHSQLPQIFERFHRVEGAKGRTHEGTGIGLALVQELVKLHGGSISVESDAGKGSLFRVCIPLSAAPVITAPGTRQEDVEAGPTLASYVDEAMLWLPDQSAERSTEPPVSGGRPTVLLADDNNDMREYLRRLLSTRYNVHAVSNGALALEWSRVYKPDLVLTDVMMPELDGFGLLQALRDDPETRITPVILVSARAGEESKVEGLDAGADDYLTKPFSARELLARVGTHIKLAEVRAKAAAAVREGELRFRRMFEANILGVVITGFGGRILDANQAFLTLTGYTKRDFDDANLQWDDITPVEYLEDDYRARRELRRQAACPPYEKEFIRKDGGRVPVLIASAILEGAYSNEESYVSFCLDLSDRKRIESQLLQMQKLESLGILAGGVAHDFNNLLVGILGNTSLVLDLTPKSDPNRSMLEDAVQASERAADLTQQLLAYAGKGKFLIQPIALSDLIRETSVLIHATVPKHVRLRLEVQPDLPLIEADRVQMQQLIMNLIINGAEAVGDGMGSVIVSTGVQAVDEEFLKTVRAGHDVTPGDYVYLEVSDTGCGMDESTLNRIFDPFFTTKFMGRGLGLAAGLGIVNGHHGAIRITSEPGKGTTFRVLFPVLESGHNPVSPLVPNYELEGAGLVLVIDDEETVRRAARSALQRYGYTVLLAEDGQEGLHLFGEVHQRVLAVILDMTMPVMDGRETLRRLQSVDPDVPVVLSSGFSQVEAASRFAGLGITDFLQKPYTARGLAQRLKEIQIQRQQNHFLSTPFSG